VNLTRLNLLAAVLMLLAVLCAGSGVFLLAHFDNAANTRQQDESTARLLAANIEGVIAHYKASARQLAERAAENGLMNDNKTSERNTFSELSAGALAKVLKLRLLPAGTRETDSSSVPELSYVCLDLLDRREKGQPVPDAELHLQNTQSAHIDVSAPVQDRVDKRILGHVLLSLDPSVVRTPLASLKPADGFAELRQSARKDEYLVIASGGDGSRKSGEPQVRQNVAGTNWQVAFWAPPAAWTPSGFELAVLATLLLLMLVFLVLSVALPQRRLGAALRHDTEVLETLFNDIRTGVLMGQYPFRLREFRMLSRELLSTGEAMIEDRRSLERRTQSDALTGLASHSVFHARLAQLHGQAKLGLTSALLVTNIDHLQEINTQLGSDAGDILIKQFAQQLRETLRQSDVVARIDGGQFAALFPFTDLEKITPVVERLRKRLAEEFDPGNGMPRAFSWSGGLTLLAQSDVDSQLALTRAQSALLEAQQQGGNRTLTQSPPA
jgi:diguanylate cyclase (GGDEF)-like protein